MTTRERVNGSTSTLAPAILGPFGIAIGASDDAAS